RPALPHGTLPKLTELTAGAITGGATATPVPFNVTCAGSGEQSTVVDAATVMMAVSVYGCCCLGENVTLGPTLCCGPTDGGDTIAKTPGDPSLKLRSAEALPVFDTLNWSDADWPTGSCPKSSVCPARVELRIAPCAVWCSVTTCDGPPPRSVIVRAPA